MLPFSSSLGSELASERTRLCFVKKLAFARGIFGLLDEIVGLVLNPLGRGVETVLEIECSTCSRFCSESSTRNGKRVAWPPARRAGSYNKQEANGGVRKSHKKNF